MGMLLLDCTLKAALLLAVAALADFSFRRTSAAARHFLWMLAIAASLVLPLANAFLPAWRILPAWNVQQPATHPAPRAHGGSADWGPVAATVPARAQPPALKEPPAIPEISPAAPPLAPVPVRPAAPSRTPFPWLAALYFTGAAALLFLIACDPLIRRRLLRNSIPASDANLLAALASAQRALQMPAASVQLRLSPRCRIPLTLGAVRPLILFPAAAVQWPADQLRMVLLHELAHIRRRDAWTHLLVRLACALYFFHPCMWLAARRIAALRERAADDLVLSRGEKPSAYAATLLHFSNLAGNVSPSPVFSAALPMARGNSQGRAFESRLRALLAPLPRRSLSARRALLLVALALAAIPPIAMLSAQPTVAAKPVDQATHIRELVYVLRNNVIWSRPEETYAAARELIEIGKPAVPDLCAELYHKPGGQAASVIAFTLRNIRDPRAVPALIDALGNTSISGSDCGDRIYDKDLWQFVVAHSMFGGDKYPEFSAPRADRAIIDALHLLTNHTVSEKKIYIAGDGTPEHVQAAKDARKADMDLWKQWWNEHSKELVTADAMAEMKTWPEGEDPVLTAGEAKFGVLFPTGKDARLSPVHDIFLEQKGEFDSRTYIDLDTGRTFAYDEGLTEKELAEPNHFITWWRRMGIDAVAQGGMMNADSKDPAKPEHFVMGLDGAELRVWQIANSRWDTFGDEVASGKPISRGKFAASAQILNRNLDTGDLENWTDFPRTYLFWTREGGRGILQILGSPDTPPGLKFRYRAYEGLPVRKVDLPPAFVPPPNLVFDKPVKLALPSPTSGKPALLDLDTGKLEIMAARPAPPAKTVLELIKDKMQNAAPPIPAESIDDNQRAAAIAAHADVTPQPETDAKLWCLACFDVVSGSVAADAW
ncbi:MAG TPA: M56 family metallopeptidase, partial [Phycisphaerae bacterium]|nr:M56 family metallopeptidase [Phycisphaerae bacterium]